MKKLFIIALLLISAVSLLGFKNEPHVFAATSGTEIIVSGSGEVSYAPDTATLYVGVETVNEDASLAQKENNVLMNSVLACLKENGIAEKDIKTSSFNIYKKYDYANMKESIFLGYCVSNTVTFKTKDLANLGSVVTKLTQSGANLINSIHFSLSNYDNAYAQALSAAVENAKTKLAYLSENPTDYSISKITEEGYYNCNYTCYDTASYLKSSFEATPIMTGEVSVKANIKVVFEK